MSAVCQVGHAGASADIDSDTPVALLSCYGRNWVQQARVSRVPYNCPKWRSGPYIRRDALGEGEGEEGEETEKAPRRRKNDQSL